jgi:hypothetical protein
MALNPKIRMNSKDIELPIQNSEAPFIYLLR